MREKIDAANTGPRSGPSLPSYQYTDEVGPQSLAFWAGAVVLS